VLSQRAEGEAERVKQAEERRRPHGKSALEQF